MPPVYVISSEEHLHSAPTSADLPINCGESDVTASVPVVSGARLSLSPLSGMRRGQRVKLGSHGEVQRGGLTQTRRDEAGRTRTNGNTK